MSEWMPIETAPRDGSAILIWCAEQEQPVVGRWGNVPMVGDCWHVAYPCHAGSPEIGKPTRWQPLPAPPVTP